MTTTESDIETTASNGRSTQHYGRILVLIVLTFSAGIAVGSETWGSIVYLSLQAVTLLLALRISEATDRQKWLSIALLVPVLVGAALSAIFGTARLGDGAIGAIGAILVAIALVAIVREVAGRPEVTGPTVMAALCIYLMIGLLFAYVEQFIGGVGSGPFFVDHGDGTPSDYLYFSYVTLTTVGYGDMVAAGNIGRSVAVAEAIIGQLYLVTVISFTVGTVARRRGG